MFNVQDQQANSPFQQGPVEDSPNRLEKEYGKSSIMERGDSKEEVEHHHQECLVKICGDHSEAKSEGDS